MLSEQVKKEILSLKDTYKDLEFNQLLEEIIMIDNINCINSQGSLLHYTIGKRFIDKMTLLLENGICPDFVDYKGCSALHKVMNYIIMDDDTRKTIVKWLLLYGIDPNIKDKNGNTALVYVKNYENQRIIEMIDYAMRNYNPNIRLLRDYYELVNLFMKCDYYTFGETFECTYSGLCKLSKKILDNRLCFNIKNGSVFLEKSPYVNYSVNIKEAVSYLGKGRTLAMIKSYGEENLKEEEDLKEEVKRLIKM